MVPCCFRGRRCDDIVVTANAEGSTLFPHLVAKPNFNISGILGERLADVLDSK